MQRLAPNAPAQPRGGRGEKCGLAATRIVAALAIGASLLVAWRWRASVAAHAAAASPRMSGAAGNELAAATPSIDAPAELAAFAAELERLRGGDDSVVASASARAERLCRGAARCDVQRVLAYYAALSHEARASGVAADRELASLWNEVREARTSAMSEVEWTPRRKAIEAALGRIVERHLDAPDFVPAARALSLRARLTARRAAGIGAEDPDEAAELWSAARSDAERARALFRRAGLKKPELEPLFVLGEIAEAHFALEEAGDAYRACLELAREVDSDAFVENALVRLATLAHSAGDLGSVRRLLRALASIRSPSTSWLLAKNHAELLLAQDLAADAARFLRAHAPRDPQELGEWHRMLGAALLRAGDLDGARVELEFVPAGEHDAESALALASFALRDGRPDEALALLEHAEFEEVNSSQRARAAWLRGEAYWKLGRPEAAVKPLVRALELGTQMQRDHESASEGALPNVLGEQVGVHTVALLAAAHADLGEDLEAARAIEAYQSLSLRGLLFGGDAPDRTGIVTDDVRAWSQSFERGLVTWVVGADFAVVVHVTPEGAATAATIERPRAQLEAAARRLREAVIVGDAAEIARLGTEIQDVLLPARVQASIERTAHGARDRLLLLLHGVLESLPIEALPFFDTHLVPLVLPGLPARAPGSPPTAASYASWTLLGSPLDESGARRLPGAHEELAGIGATCASARTLSDDDFTRDALIAALRGTEPVHIATHLAFGVGTRSWRLANVGFELSRGESLAAHEILEIRPVLPLAVLSACETGGGDLLDAEGLQSVARAFLESGTRNLLATLWPVEDGAARTFAIEFHRALRAGDAPSRATAHARTLLRRAGAPPADWAAFRLLGRD
ncbi:MAG: CHAT domain-containing protein [Planctomycetota bacterium]